MGSAGGRSRRVAGDVRACVGDVPWDVPGGDLVALLHETLVDTDKSVRVEAARAIGNVGGMGAALVLRLRALMGQVKPDVDTPEVLGAVYAALLSIEGAAAIPLVAAALEDGDDMAAEAAFALAETRLPEALQVLIARMHGSGLGGVRRAEPDAWFGGALTSAIAMTRLPEAFDFLIGLVERESRRAAAALDALGRIGASAEIRERIEKAVEGTGSERLHKAFQEHFSGPRP